LLDHYVKDEVPDALVLAVARLNFDLPEIAVFDCDAGLQAVKDRRLGSKEPGAGG